MKRLFLFFSLVVFLVESGLAQVSISKSSSGWELDNGHIQAVLQRSGGNVVLRTLRRENGAEWTAPNSPILVSPEKSGAPYKFTTDAISDAGKGGKQLTLTFESQAGGELSLMVRIYPERAVLEMATRIGNKGSQSLLLNSQIDPLVLTLNNPAGGLKPYSSSPGRHGFYPAANTGPSREYNTWLVLENGAAGESMLIGGEPGLGVLGWRATTRTSAASTAVEAGTILLKDKKDGSSPAFELAPGKTIETPISFFAIAKGDTDNAGNETFRYLKQYIFQAPVANSPLVTYCIWLTEKNSEEPLLEELKVAKRAGFDVYYHDATWYEGASVVPGMNDWSKGLGSYDENKEKFPHGIKSLSDAVRAAGLKFGIWVDPGNVDASRVESGEIPTKWLAMIDGKTLGGMHPSLTPTKELCLGDPEVVDWLKKKLGDIIEKWNLEWIKWDPSSTVSYECNRTDHGHGKTDGAYAAYRGRMEIMRYLLERFPNLIGFECDPSLYYSRTNPGPREFLPGGYTNEFITGPMVSPHVWGSLATAGKGDASASYLTARWYSASALDYYIRKNLTHGASFGNINGMSSQLFSQSPAGYQEAFRRNLYYFKQYRHLLYEDVYHPKITADGWSSIEYVKPDASESVVFVFRDKSPAGQTSVALRGLQAGAKYRVTSLNDRPGRDRVISAEDLMKGLEVKLPDKWLAEGDGVFSDDYSDQLTIGSDVLLLERVP